MLGVRTRTCFFLGDIIQPIIGHNQEVDLVLKGRLAGGTGVVTLLRKAEAYRTGQNVMFVFEEWRHVPGKGLDQAVK